VRRVALAWLIRERAVKQVAGERSVRLTAADVARERERLPAAGLGFMTLGQRARAAAAAALRAKVVNADVRRALQAEASARTASAARDAIDRAARDSVCASDLLVAPCAAGALP
jgi:hypothetical protein